METVRILESLHNLFYAPLYVTQALGFFEREGLHIDLRTRRPGEDVVGLLREGEVDIALAGPMRSLVAADAGDRPLPLSFVEVNSRDGFMLLSRQPAKDFAWQDLEGSTVLTYREPPTPWLCLVNVLKVRGIDPERVGFSIDRPLPDAIVAFRQGIGDYIELPEPQAGELLAEGAAYLAAPMGHFVGAIPYTAFAAMPTYLERQQDIALRFTRAVYAGQRWLAANSPSAIAAMTASALAPTALEILTEGVARYRAQSTWAADPLLRREGFNRLQAILRDGGLIKVLHSYDELVTIRLAKAIMAEG